MNKRKKGLCEFVVACGDTAELLDATEETLDQVAAFVDMPVKGTGVVAIGTRGYNRYGTLRGDCCDKGIRVVPLVGYYEFSRLIFDPIFLF